MGGFDIFFACANRQKTNVEKGGDDTKYTNEPGTRSTIHADAQRDTDAEDIEKVKHAIAELSTTESCGTTLTATRESRIQQFISNNLKINGLPTGAIGKLLIAKKYNDDRSGAIHPLPFLRLTHTILIYSVKFLRESCANLARIVFLWYNISITYKLLIATCLGQNTG